ncbi:transglycosylase [Synechococcus sp. HK05]|uniref:type IV pilus biogenesis protein EbsA n=1 Tax=Synechococcus sp. HK05 TaxID=2725975 RepID=UPI001C38A23B|nr:type IV pilus biogenesis protein EbsA [Synechococcus sp. HK05]MBV2351287.1 transglycosylase [Synechococcus sp. HK05]
MSAALVALFAPYCQGAADPSALEQGLQLLARGHLQGQRPLRPEGQRPFELHWQPGIAPLESAQVQLSVQGQGLEQPARYSFELPTHRLLQWLMAWQAAGGAAGQPADLPEPFWQWLILGLDSQALQA